MSQSNELSKEFKNSIRLKFPLSSLKLNQMPAILFPKPTYNSFSFYENRMELPTQNYKNLEETKYTEQLDGMVSHIFKKRIEPSFLTKRRKTQVHGKSHSPAIISSNEAQELILSGKVVGFDLYSDESSFRQYDSCEQIRAFSLPINIVAAQKTEQFVSRQYIQASMFLEELQNQEQMLERLTGFKSETPKKHLVTNRQFAQMKNQCQFGTPKNKSCKNSNQNSEHVQLGIGSDFYKLPIQIVAQELKNEDKFERTAEIQNFRWKYKQNRGHYNSPTNLMNRTSDIQKTKVAQLSFPENTNYPRIKIKNNKIKYEPRVIQKEEIKDDSYHSITDFMQFMNQRKQQREQVVQIKRNIITNLQEQQNQQMKEKMSQLELQMKIQKQKEQQDFIEKLQKERIHKLKLRKQQKIKDLKKEQQQTEEKLKQFQLEQDNQERQIVETQSPYESLYNQAFLKKKYYSFFKEHSELINKIQDRVNNISQDKACDYNRQIIKKVYKKQVQLLSDSQNSNLSPEIKAKLKAQFFSILKEVKVKTNK